MALAITFACLLSFTAKLPDKCPIIVLPFPFKRFSWYFFGLHITCQRNGLYESLNGIKESWQLETARWVQCALPGSPSLDSAVHPSRLLLPCDIFLTSVTWWKAHLVLLPLWIRLLNPICDYAEFFLFVLDVGDPRSQAFITWPPFQCPWKNDVYGFD